MLHTNLTTMIEQLQKLLRSLKENLLFMVALALFGLCMFLAGVFMVLGSHLGVYIFFCLAAVACTAVAVASVKFK